MYLSWAVLYEGTTDASYFNVLIPRLMEELALAGDRLPTVPADPAIRLRRQGPEGAAAEACGAKEAFHLIFIHADTGGRNQAAGIGQRSTAYCEAMRDLCGWREDRCITITPSHETEAWVLADPDAVTDLLGYAGGAAKLGLPPNAAAAERLVDPKAVLQQAVAIARGRRRPPNVDQIYPAVAQRQSFDALRGSPSFRVFEATVRTAMTGLGCL